MSEVRLTVEPRTEFGKGAARRTRRAGKIPAVLYGHGSDPRHLSLPSLEFARIVREHGANAVITLDVENSTELALTKTVVVHPLRNYIEHVDLLVVKRGEKIAVDVKIVLTGTPDASTLVNQDVDTIQIEVDALNIPETIEVSIEGLEAGTQILASQVELPAGSTLVTDADHLIVAVNEAPTEASMEAGDAEAPAAEEPAAE